jgi:hypothetical protein
VFSSSSLPSLLFYFIWYQSLNRPTPIFRSFTLQPLSNIKPSSSFKFSTFMLHVFLQPNLSRKLNHPFHTAPVLPTAPFGQSAEDPTPADIESIPRDHGPNLSPLFPFLFTLSQNFYQTPHLHMTSTEPVLPKISLLFNEMPCS